MTHPSRTTLWRWRMGRTTPRPAPPGSDAVWCAAHESDIRRWASAGAAQAIGFARRAWGQWDTLAQEETRRELVAVGMLRICEISAHHDRDRPGFMLVAARWACQSHIRQHVVGWLKRAQLMPAPPTADIAVPENCAELVAQLMALYPGPIWDHWRDDPARTGESLRHIMAACAAKGD